MYVSGKSLTVWAFQDVSHVEEEPADFTVLPAYRKHVNTSQSVA